MATNLLRDVGQTFKPTSLLSNIKSTVSNTVDNIVGNSKNESNIDSTVTYNEILSLPRVNQIAGKLKTDDEEPLTIDEIKELLEPFSESDFNENHYVNTILDKNKYDKRIERRLLKFDKNILNQKVFNRFTEKQDVIDSFEYNEDDDLDDLSSPNSSTPFETSNITQLLNPAVAGKKIVKGAMDAGKRFAKEMTEAGHDAEDLLTGKKFQMMQQEKNAKVTKNVQDHNEKVMKKMSEVVSRDLINDVYQHYGFFIQTSKHIERMDRELVELSNLWNEMKTNISNVLITLNSASSLMNDLGKTESGSVKSIRESEENNENLKTMVISKIKELNNDFYNTLKIRDFESSIKIYDYGRKIVEQYMINPKMNNQHLKKKRQQQKEGDESLYDMEDIEEEETDIEIIENFNHTTELFVETLLSELRNSRNTSYSELLVKYLSVLNYKEESISVYLEAQGNMIDELISHIFIGDPLALSEELSKRFFKAISLVCDNYVTIFGDGLKKQTIVTQDEEESSTKSSRSNTLSSRNDNTATDTSTLRSARRTTTVQKQQPQMEAIPQGHHNSGFINWVVNQTLDKFCMKFKRSIGSVLRYDFKKMTSALIIAFNNANKLNIQGLSVLHLLKEFFRHDLEISVASYVEQKDMQLFEIVAKESWKAFDFDLSNVPNLVGTTTGTIRITESGRFIYTFANEYLEYLKPIANVFLYQAAVNSVQGMMEEYILEIFRTANTHLNDDQFCCMITNLINVRYHFLPKLVEKLKTMFELELAQFNTLIKNTEDIEQRILDRFCENRVVLIIEQLRIDEPNVYPANAPTTKTLISEITATEEGKIQASQVLIKFVKYLTKAQTTLAQYPQISKAETVPGKLCELFIKHMGEIAYFWNLLEKKKEKEESTTPTNRNATLSILQVNSIILDIFFFQQVCEPIMTEQAKKSLAELKQRVIDKYCAITGSAPNEVTKDDSFYQFIIKKLIQENESVKQTVKFFKDTSSTSAATTSTASSSMSTGRSSPQTSSTSSSYTGRTRKY